MRRAVRWSVKLSEATRVLVPPLAPLPLVVKAAARIKRSNSRRRQASSKRSRRQMLGGRKHARVTGRGLL